MVSIIVPTYNNAHLISETLKSIWNQTYSDWECLVIDNGSTDNTSDVVRIFCESDRRFIYVYQRNNGVSAARNAGLRLLKGDYVQFLDSDDLLETDKISRQVEYLENNEDVDVVYSDFMRFASDIPGKFSGEAIAVGAGYVANSEMLPKLIRGNFLRINTPLLRRRVIDIVGFFRENLYSVEDWEYWMRCACRRIKFTYYTAPAANVLVRINPNGLSHDLQTMQRHYLPALQEIFIHESLGIRNRLILLGRASAFLLRSLAGDGSKIQFGAEGKYLFAFLVIAYSCILFPFYLVYKLARSMKNEK